MTTLITSSRFTVTHRQICVFDHAMSAPFNDWRKEDVAQGFAWREGSVSFGTVLDGGTTDVEVAITSILPSPGAATRAILVPFTVPPSGELEIATVSGESLLIKLTPGGCALLFENGAQDQDRMWCRFTFSPGRGTEPKVLITDAGLQPTYPLRLDARAAV